MPHAIPRQLSRLTLLAALVAGATAAGATGLAPLYQEARLSDPQYAAAKAEREAVEALVPQARGQLLPQISASGSKAKTDTTFEQRNTLFGTQSKDYTFTAKNASINLSQAIFRPQTWLAYAQTLAQVRQAEGNFRQASQDLIIRLSQAYFEALLAEDNVALSGEQKAAITEQLKQAKRYFEAGVGTITDINEAQARHDTIVAQEIAAKNTLEVRIRALEQFVGKVYRQLDRLGPRLQLESPTPSEVETWLEFAMDNNPQIKAAEAALEVAQNEVHKGWAGHLPTVDLVASKSRSQDPSFTMIDTNNWTSSVGIQVSVPIFSGGTTHGRVQQVTSLREKAEKELEAARRSVTLATRQEYLNIINGVAQVKALEQAVKSNEVALYSARKGQEAGLRTSFDVLNAQQLLFTAKRDLAQARYGYVLSRLKLRAASGLLGEEDVALVESWLDR